MPGLRNLSLYDIYAQNAQHFPDSPALIHNGQTITYNQLFSQTQKLAQGLNEQKISPGSRIAVLSQNHPMFFDIFGAAAAQNLILVLINRRLSQEEIKYIIEDTSPDLLIADQELADLAKSITDEFSCLKRYFLVDCPEPGLDLKELYLDTPLTFPVLSSRDDGYMIIHTAAVQGKPRGALLSHENILLCNQHIISTFNLSSKDSYLNILPLFHIMGINLSLSTLQAGGKNVIQVKFKADESLNLISRHKVSLLGTFPPILSNLIEAAENSSQDLSSLKYAIGLEQEEVVQKWEKTTKSKFWSMYGQTETSGLITFSEFTSRPGSAGRPTPLVNLQIADEFDNLFFPGQTGEIVVRGPLVFQGYWQADDLNAHTFRENWHHTGDLGSLDELGYLFFKGRKAEKELIKSGGENVFPVEVEKAILEHESIEEACVFGVADPKFGEGIKAVCVLRPGAEFSEQDLIAFTGSRIASYKKPRYVCFVKELPKTKDGSVDREKVKQDYAQE